MGTIGANGIKTTSNDIMEVLKYLGVEAARSVTMYQIKEVMDAYSMTIDVRHTMLLADCMTSKVGRPGSSANEPHPSPPHPTPTHPTSPHLTSPWPPPPLPRGRCPGSAPGSQLHLHLFFAFTHSGPGDAGWHANGTGDEHALTCCTTSAGRGAGNHQVWHCQDEGLSAYAGLL